MSDKSWKKFERECAALIGGVRYPANMGGKIDVESDTIVGQVKEVATLPLAEQARLVLEIDAIGKKKGKRGVLFVRLKGGRGVLTPWLLVVNVREWEGIQ